MLAYLDATQKGAGILLDAPRRIAAPSHMAIDAATRDSLELDAVGRRQRRRQPARRDRPLPDRRRAAACCARTCRAPLTDRRAIEARLALVAWLHEDAIRRERVRQALKAMPDFARALARLAAGRGSPRDLALLRDGLAAAAALKASSRPNPSGPALLDELLPRLGGHGALVDRLRARAGRIAADRRVEGRLHRRRL